MSKIKSITKLTNKSSGKVRYQVIYESQRHYDYTGKDNLPMPVVEILLNGECETHYYETGKVEYFRPANA